MVIKHGPVTGNLSNDISRNSLSSTTATPRRCFELILLEPHTCMSLEAFTSTPILCQYAPLIRYWSFSMSLAWSSVRWVREKYKLTSLSGGARRRCGGKLLINSPDASRSPFTGHNFTLLNVIPNAVMIAKPRHPFWLQYMSVMGERAASPDPPVATGPNALKDALLRWTGIS